MWRNRVRIIVWGPDHKEKKGEKENECMRKL